MLFNLITIEQKNLPKLQISDKPLVNQHFISPDKLAGNITTCGGLSQFSQIKTFKLNCVHCKVNAESAESIYLIVLYIDMRFQKQINREIKNNRAASEIMPFEWNNNRRLL